VGQKDKILEPTRARHIMASIPGLRIVPFMYFSSCLRAYHLALKRSGPQLLRKDLATSVAPRNTYSTVRGYRLPRHYLPNPGFRCAAKFSRRHCEIVPYLCLHTYARTSWRAGLGWAGWLNELVACCHACTLSGDTPTFGMYVLVLAMSSSEIESCNGGHSYHSLQHEVPNASPSSVSTSVCIVL
jgi:hypothetical protein